MPSHAKVSIYLSMLMCTLNASRYSINGSIVLGGLRADHGAIPGSPGGNHSAVTASLLRKSPRTGDFVTVRGCVGVSAAVYANSPLTNSLAGDQHTTPCRSRLSPGPICWAEARGQPFCQRAAKQPMKPERLPA